LKILLSDQAKNGPKPSKQKPLHPQPYSSELSVYCLGSISFAAKKGLAIPALHLISSFCLAFNIVD
jgi:hypothetical protein